MKRLLYAAVISFCIHTLILFFGYWDTNNNVTPNQTEFIDLSVSISEEKTAPQKSTKKTLKKITKKKPVHKKLTQKTITPEKIMTPVKPKKTIPETQEKKAQDTLENIAEKEIVSEAKKPDKNVIPQKAIEKMAKGVLNKRIPELMNGKKQVYPRAAKKRNIQGTVMLELFIEQDGSTSKCKISKSSGFLILDKAALESAKNWRFKAGSYNGIDSGMWVEIPVMYELK